MMAFKDMLESLSTKEDKQEIEIYELTLGWLTLTNSERAQVIEGAKKTGEFNRQLIKEIAEDAKKYQEVYELSDKEEAIYQKMRASAAEKLKGVSRKDFGKVLKQSDDALDRSQELAGKLKNVPLLGKAASRTASDLGTAEAGIKAARVTNALGASPETSAKVAFTTAKGVKGAKDIASDISGGVGKAVDTASEAGETASKAIRKFAGEHGGKAAAAAAAGLGALGLVKALRRKKSTA
jgi:flagellar hook-basal body complex protein FliE